MTTLTKHHVEQEIIAGRFATVHTSPPPPLPSPKGQIADGFDADADGVAGDVG